MNNRKISIKKAFTLLELLLVVAALGILITAVLVLLDPDQQLRRVEEVNRSGDMQALESALREYNLVNRSYPEGITSESTEVCNTGSLSEGEGGIDCEGRIDLRVLVPQFMNAIPVSNLADGNGTGYRISLNSMNRISIIEMPAVYDIVATGGTISDVSIDGTNYRLHTYTTVGTSTFSVTSARPGAEVEYLIVGGGGGGGRYAGGGGGGGGVQLGTFEIFPQTYPVTVGGGGEASYYFENKGETGGSSVFANIEIPGGGGGGSMNSRPGANGSSGGGGAHASNGLGGSGVPGFGFSGGGSVNQGNGAGTVAGGGGGGAASAGVDAIVWGSGWDYQSGGSGGNGVQLNFDGTSQYFGGGGGGAGRYNSEFSNYMLGGLGGGGNGGIINSPGGNVNAQAGQPNTGGGGGGCPGGCSQAGAGGSGIVMIRYRI